MVSASISASHDSTNEEATNMKSIRNFFESGETEMVVGKATCYSDTMEMQKWMRPKFHANFIHGNKIVKFVITNNCSAVIF